MTTGPRHGPELAQKFTERLPGYSGHIPGKHSENIFGKTFMQANDRAISRRESAPTGASMRAASEPRAIITGYAGHMPGSAENVFGMTYRDVMHNQKDVVNNRAASASNRATPRSEKLDQRPGTEVHGYAGHIPGYHTQRVGVAKYRISQEQATWGPQHTGSIRTPRWVDRGDYYDHAPAPVNSKPAVLDAGHTIPGYQGHMMGHSEPVCGVSKVRADKDKQVEHGLSDTSTATPRSVDNHNHQQKNAVFLAGSIPGYKGHIPGKGPEMVVGATFSSANAQAQTDRFFGDGSRLPSGYSTPRSDVSGAEVGAMQMASVPGYRGHVPGKNANNVIGMSHAKANIKAARDKFSAEGVHHSAANPEDRYRPDSTSVGCVNARGFNMGFDAEFRADPAPGIRPPGMSRSSSRRSSDAGSVSNAAAPQLARTMPGEEMQTIRMDNTDKASVASSRRSARGATRRDASWDAGSNASNRSAKSARSGASQNSLARGNVNGRRPSLGGSSLASSRSGFSYR